MSGHASHERPLLNAVVNKCVEIIDLSQPIYQGMPVYPGHLKTVVWTHHTHDETLKQIGTGFSYETRGIMISDHGPTHVDAFNHIDPEPGAAAIDEVPLEWLITPAVCVDVTRAEPQSYITREIIKHALDACELVPPKGGTFLLWTGHYERHYGSPVWLEAYPGLDREGTEWLADVGVINIGIDAPSIDTPADRDYPAHQVCRERKLLNTENLGGLGRVAGVEFVFVALPLRIEGGTASPVRAVALIDRQSLA